MTEEGAFRNEYLDRIAQDGQLTDKVVDSIRAVVPIRCERCLRRHGRGTPMGDMLLLPRAMVDPTERPRPGHRWVWAAARRTTDGLTGRRVIVRDTRFVSEGGIEAHCRRCDARPRFKLAKLIELAEVAHVKGDVAAYV